MKNFFGGIPTEIEVRRIMERWPMTDMKEGDEIAYADMAAVINSEYGSFRFRTVTSRWRKMIENEAGIIIGTKEARCFVVLNNGQKLSLSRAKMRMSGRAALRAYKTAAVIDAKKLTDAEKKEYDHTVSKAAAVMATMRIKSKNILPDV
jgi:hypothetical protein